MVGAVIDNSANANLNNLTTQAGAGLNSAGIRTVVETYKNGTSWYRIWSDGWCEQGGQATGITGGNKKYVNLIKTMADRSYSVISSIVSTNDTFVGDDGTESTYNVSASQIWISFSANSSPLTINYIVRGFVSQS